MRRGAVGCAGEGGEGEAWGRGRPWHTCCGGEQRKAVLSGGELHALAAGEVWRKARQRDALHAGVGEQTEALEVLGERGKAGGPGGGDGRERHAHRGGLFRDAVVRELCDAHDRVPACMIACMRAWMHAACAGGG
jgi:hypothetical protein